MIKQGKYIRTPETREKMRLAHLGKKHTEEQKRKIGLANRTGEYMVCLNCNRKFYICRAKTKTNNGYKRKYCCIGCVREDYKGKRHHLWTNGLYTTNPSKYLREFRKSKGKAYLQACTAKRRALGKVSIGVVQTVYEDNIKFYGTLTCIYCLLPIEFGKDSLEHKNPIKRGGTNAYENLAIACRSCNSAKGSKTYEEFKETKN